jgi:hypothetical protein
MPDSCMVATEVEKLNFGTDLLSDMNEAMVIDMTPNDGSDNVRVVMRYRCGTQIVTPTDIVIGYVNP